MQVIIREAEEQDLQSIISLYSQMDMNHEQVIPPANAGKIFQLIKNYPFFKIYVAVLNEQIIGTFELVIIDNLAHKGIPSGIIENVVVSEQHRKNGVGKAMMQYAMNVCKEMGCYKVTLSSNVKREDAHRFYESLGFKKHGYSFYVQL